ncbi:alkaline phosphatase D family protein [Flagellimonas myxillae]|uniref:alkaline phosphatase D family protein n=1 Tax=Flagellimonas myxillae TaxID=2942214 RepID=UPI00201F19FA|nr:alkaline phosphatase D family protein [Muricauda myxillae]MCL6265371.1 alkaline phosphatase family protein [Muricauda myxillae]
MPSIAANGEISNPIFRIAFGSCNKQDLDNLYWDDILKLDPQVWIWGGDNIYADTDDMELLKSLYAQQNKVEGYALLKSQVPVIGTWDDHDYGLNDGGEEFTMKAGSQQEFLDFLGVTPESERRTRKGVYASHDFETPEGNVKFLVLDTRYFRSPLEKDPDPSRRYKVNTTANATILGNAQWEWLQTELNASKADFNLIVTSIQFLSREHGFESWGNFPKEIEKMNQLITNSKAKGVIMLSGDRHISEFSKTVLEGMSYPIVDFTSSGLTHSYADFKEEPNAFRVGEVVSTTSFGLIELNFRTEEVHFKIHGENGLIHQELKQAY